MNARMFSNMLGSPARRVVRANPLPKSYAERPACGDWVESSFDLTRGVEVTEGLSVEEFEHWGGHVKSLPVALLRR